jgi:hypothetical protein
MSIIINQTPPVLTTEQKQTRLKALLQNSVNILWKQMLSTYQGSMKAIWQNPDGLTPQQAFDAFGTDAVELVRLAGIQAATLNNVQAGTVDTSAVPSFTVNQDGTITVG